MFRSMGKAWCGRVSARLLIATAAVLTFGSVPAKAEPAGASAMASVCEGYQKKQIVRRLGGRNAFVRPGVKDVAGLQAAFAKNADGIRKVLQEQGLGDLADALLAAIASGQGITQRELGAGDKLEWMAYRKRGEAMTIDDICLALKNNRNNGAFEIKIPVVTEKKPVDATCKLTVSADCPAGCAPPPNPTGKADATGSSAGAKLSMTTASGTKDLRGSTWMGELEDPYRKPTSFTVKADGTPGSRTTTYHTFVIPMACVNLAYAGTTTGAPEILPAKSCSETKATNSPACVAAPPEINLTVEPTEVFSGEKVTLKGDGCWYADRAKVGIVNGQGEAATVEEGQLEGLTRPFSQELLVRKPGNYTATAEVANVIDQTASGSASFEIKPRWRLRPYVLSLTPKDETQSTVVPAVGATPEERTFFDVGNAIGVGVGLEYLFSDRVGLGSDVFLARMKANVVHDYGTAWGMDDDKFTSLGLSVGPNFHLTPDKRFDLYIGPFLGLYDLGKGDFEGAAGRNIDREFDVSLGYGLLLGLDIPFKNDCPWGLHFGGRYTKLKAEVEETGKDLDIDPLSFAAGLSYRF